MNNLVSYLFETNAIRVCPDKSPFWYTSGKIGPYFVNTHFLYGNEEDAANLLKFIDDSKDDKLNMPSALFAKIKEQYETNNIYHNVINEMIDYIKSNINIDEIDFISGGERRDWFFSYIAAFLLNKPHLTIFKDLTCVITDYDFSNAHFSNDIHGKKVLHIADLMNQASSYIRAWIPAIQDMSGELVWSLVLVDRMQGGKKRLEDLGIKSYAISSIDSSLFKTALEKGIINEEQFEMIEKFIEDPDGTMRQFLLDNPDFIKNALNSDEKTASRAKLCRDSNLYNL